MDDFQSRDETARIGAHDNSKLWLMFYIIIESNPQKTFYSIVLCTNMAAVTSGENHQKMKGNINPA